MEVLLASNIAHDVDHPCQPRIRSRRPGRADDQRDASLDRAGHHDLSIALDRGRGEHAGAGGKGTWTGVGAAGITADHTGARRNRLIKRFSAKSRTQHARRRNERKRSHRDGPRSLLHAKDIACHTNAENPGNCIRRDGLLKRQWLQPLCASGRWNLVLPSLRTGHLD